MHVLKPAEQLPENLPSLDLIFSIDAFVDLPVLVRELIYRKNLKTTPVRFIALNKTTPDGYFWVRGDKKIREAHSKTPVSIDIYDVTALGKSGSYRHLATIKVEPTSEQIDKGINFINDPDRKTSQSPFDVEKDPNINPSFHFA